MLLDIRQMGEGLPQATAKITPELYWFHPGPHL